MATSFLLALAVLLTSTLSGVFAMGGGVILLAVLLNILPVTQAMIYHGVIQFFANTFRAAMSWRFISLKIMSFYLLGSIVGSYFLFQMVYTPQKALILIAVGLLTLVGPYLHFIHINVNKASGALLCGVLLSWLNVLAGASGPLSNMFFLKSGLSRFQLIATKSATQSVAHIIKVLFYAGIFSSMKETSLNQGGLLLLILSALTFVGGWIGKWIVEKISEDNFRRYGFWVISLFGAGFTLQGIYLYFQ